MNEVVYESRSLRSPELKPSFLRFVRYHGEFQLLFYVMLITLGIGAPMWGIGMELAERNQGFAEVIFQVLGVIGFLIMLGGVLVGLLLRWMWKQTRNHFMHGLLTPGVVFSENPLQLMVLANMATNPGSDFWGLRRVDLPTLPVHENRAGVRVPCCATFLDGPESAYWGYCNVDPLCLGTKDVVGLERSLDRITEAEFAFLQRLIDQGEIPHNDQDLLLFNADGELLKVVSHPSLSKSNE